MARKIVKYQVEEKKYSDTSEIFDSLFGKALRILFRRENREEDAEKYEQKRRRKQKKSRLSKKNIAPKGATPEPEGIPKGVKSGTEKIISGAKRGEAPIGVTSETDKKPSATKMPEAPRDVKRITDETPRSETQKTYKSPIKYEKSEKANLKAIVKAKKSRRRKKMSKRQPQVESGKRRTVLAFVLLLVLAGGYFYYQGVGDFGKITGSIKSIKKENIPLVKDLSKLIGSLTSSTKKDTPRPTTTKVPASTDKKPTGIARKPMPKGESSPQSKTATPQKNLLIVKKPHTPVVKETPTPANKQSYRPVAKESPKPAAEHPHIPAFDNSPKPAAEVSHPPAVKTSPRPVVKASDRAVAHTQKREVSASGSSLPAKPPVSYPYSIYLGSYGSSERAKKAMSRYEKKGLSPYWVEVDLGDKGIWFRIFTGYFPNREEAEAYINEKQITEAKSRRTRYANLIGVYISQSGLNRTRLALSKLGYSPYVIAGVNGESLLYAGAFYQKKRAEEQHTRLASKGIRSRVVSR
jgi:hypothetical protein